MKKRYLYLLTSLLGFLILTGCSSNSGEDEDNPLPSGDVVVTFDSSIGSNSETHTLTLESGQSIEEVLTVFDKAKLDEITSSIETNIFQGWYTTRYGATYLVNDEYFDLSTEITADLYLFAGYSDSTINSFISDYVAQYLGVYEEYDIDPLPKIEAQQYSLINDLGNSFKYSNVSSNTLSKFYDSLINYYGFTLVEGTTYLSKEGIYFVTYDYNSSTQELTVNITFDDEVGEFPTHYFASNFYGIDYSYYINDSTFSLADTVFTSDEDRFITHSMYNNGVKSNYIIFTPSTDYTDPLSETITFFETYGLSLSSTIGYYTDTYQSAYVDIDYVDDSEVTTFRTYGINLNTSMVKIEVMENPDREQLDTELLNYALSYYFDQTGVPDLPYVLEATAYSSIYISYSSSYYYTYAPMYYALGVDETYLENYVAAMVASGWSSSVSGTTYKSITLRSPTYRYQISLVYYPRESYVDINTNFVTVTFIRYTNVFDYLYVQMYYQSNGGTTGIVTNIPEFVASGYSSGTISSSTTVGYYILGYGTTLDTYNEFVSALSSDSSWVVQTQETYDTTFVSSCGFYTLNAYYRGGVIRVELIYNATTDVSTLTEANTLIRRRLSYNMDQTVVNTLTNYNSLTVLQYFDGSYNRAILYYNYNTEAEAEDAYNTLSNALSENLTYLATSSVVFYEDDNELIYYVYYEEATYGYRVGLVAYNPN